MPENIRLERVIDKELAQEIEKESVSVSPHLAYLRVCEDLQSAEFEVDGDGDPAVVEVKVKQFLLVMLARVKRSDPKVYAQYARRDGAEFHPKPYEELVNRGWVVEIGPGHVALSGGALRLFDYIDALAARLHETEFGASPRSFPAFVPGQTLHRCGYFDAHPNNVTMVTHLVDDFDAIEGFRTANETGPAGLTIPDRDMLAQPHVCMNPAACLPSYPIYEGRTLPSEGVALTWRGRIFRYESRNARGLERLWEFNVRELVLMGSGAQVTDGTRRMHELVETLVTRLNLSASLESASDPFFATVAAARKFWQESMDSKQEIRLAVGDGRDGVATVSAGSVNAHGRFFGDRFDITDCDRDRAHTACMGLGLERWVLACFAQHGFEPKRWPAEAAEVVFS